MPSIMKNNCNKILLASSSPRRRQLVSTLFQHIMPVEFIAPQTNEVLPTATPANEAAILLAKLKMKGVLQKYGIARNTLVITADTIVVAEGKILGKPSDKQEAYDFLSLLSGKEHEVISAFCISCQENTVCMQDATIVKFTELSKDDISHYIEKYRPFDKAGAYGIQEWIGLAGISSIKGSFYTVMGLPTHLLFAQIRKMIVE